MSSRSPSVGSDPCSTALWLQQLSWSHHRSSENTGVHLSFEIFQVVCAAKGLRGTIVGRPHISPYCFGSSYFPNQFHTSLYLLNLDGKDDPSAFVLQMSPDVSCVGVACFIGMSAGASLQFKEADRECLIKQPLGKKKTSQDAFLFLNDLQKTTAVR